MSNPAPDEAAELIAPTLEFRDILSDDGTYVRAWTNDADGVIDGPTVVLCNGLGTNAFMWPALLAPDCGIRVISWNHRGVGGSQRPRDKQHVHIEHFVEDGLSVMDHFGVDRAVLMGWSMGVNTMFELTARHPERVLGLFAMCGVPGDTFATMLEPFRLPRVVNRVITVNACRFAKLTGWTVNPIVKRLPVNAKVVDLISHTGFLFHVADPEAAAVGIKEFIQTPVDWYAHLAIATSRHARVSLSALDVPARFVAGTWDILAGSRDMGTAADRMKDADYFELRGSHFLQLEQPEVVHELLKEFVDKVYASHEVES